jgi:hypothetical protein
MAALSGVSPALPLSSSEIHVGHFASPTSSTTAIAVSPAAQPVNRPKPPPRRASSSISSMIGARAHRRLRMAPDQRAAVVVHGIEVGAGLPGKEEVVGGKGVVGLDRGHLGDAAAGLLQRALRRRQHGLGHVGQRTRARPKPCRRTAIFGLVDSSRALSRVVTTIAALPSAGCVWPPKVTTPPGITGLSLARPSGVDCDMPSSPVMLLATFLKLGPARRRAGS